MCDPFRELDPSTWLEVVVCRLDQSLFIRDIAKLSHVDEIEFTAVGEVPFMRDVHCHEATVRSVVSGLDGLNVHA